MIRIKNTVDINKLAQDYCLDIINTPLYQQLIYNHIVVARNRVLLIDENTAFMDLNILFRKLKSDGVLEEINDIRI